MRDYTAMQSNSLAGQGQPQLPVSETNQPKNQQYFSFIWFITWKFIIPYTVSSKQKSNQMGTSICQTQDSQLKEPEITLYEDHTVTNFERCYHDLPSELTKIPSLHPRAQKYPSRCSRQLDFALKPDGLVNSPIKNQCMQQDHLSCEVKPITFSTQSSLKDLDSPTRQCLALDKTDSTRTNSVKSEEIKETILIEKEQFIKVKRSQISKNYRLHEKLGEGAFGQVFRGECLRTGANRAIKILRRNSLVNPQVKDQFMTECKLLKLIDHPNIIKVFEVYQWAGSMHIITELCSSSLASHIKQDVHFSPSVIRQILKQLFTAVHYLHNLNIFHRDLKPDNILFVRKLTSDSQPQDVDLRIIDLGLAVQESQPIFRDWSHIGTHNYMAPEVFSGIYSAKCDVWACGVITHFLMLGFNPFKGHDSTEVRNKIFSFKGETISKDIDYNSRDLLIHLLDLSYESRLDISAALSHAYFRQNHEKSGKNTKAVDFLQRIKVNYDQNDLESAVKALISYRQTSQAESNKWAGVFKQMDLDKNGSITLNQLKQYADKHKWFERGNSLQKWFKQTDYNKSNTLSFSEFLTGIQQRNDIFNEKQLKEAFCFIDLNNNGYIEKDELKYFLKTIGKDQFCEIFERIDKDSNNRISQTEFCRYFSQNF